MSVWLDADLFTLSIAIFLLVIGPAVGNYACSVIYRLPLGKTPFERNPFCGHCGTDLKPIDLFPILSWCMTRGACRYCGGKIPALYTIVELLCGAFFIGYFLHFGMSEQFLLYSAYGVMVVILMGIHFQQGWIAATIYSYAIAVVLIVRTLTEGTIYGAVKGFFVMLILVLGLMRLAGNKANPFERPWVWWFVLMGTVLPMAQWHLILPVYAIKLLVPKDQRVAIYTAAALLFPLTLPSLT